MAFRTFVHGSLVGLALVLPAALGSACGDTERLNPADFSPPDGGATATVTSSGSASSSGAAGGQGGAGTTSATTTSATTTSATAGGAGGNGAATTTAGVGGAGGAGGMGASTATAGGMGGAGGSATTAGAGGSGGTGGMGATTATAASTTATTSAGSGGSGGGGATCNTLETAYAVQPSPHVAECTPVVYSSVPPTSGPHYPFWAAFKTYSAPIPTGYWVHSLEHGAVVVLYNCPAGCSAELAALDAYLAAIPADPLCVAPLAHRFIVVPDPTLPTMFAASAWGHGLTSDCFDLPALGAFITTHYAMAPENFCFQGTDIEALPGGIPCSGLDGGLDGG